VCVSNLGISNVLEICVRQHHQLYFLLLYSDLAKPLLALILSTSEYGKYKHDWERKAVIGLEEYGLTLSTLPMFTRPVILPPRNIERGLT